jgi:hypothetical protein
LTSRYRDAIGLTEVEGPFISAKKAHPALLVDTIQELEALGDASWVSRP